MPTKKVQAASASKSKPAPKATDDAAVDDVANDVANAALNEVAGPLLGAEGEAAADQVIDKELDRYAPTVWGKVDRRRAILHALRKGVYGTCYGLSYGVVYSAVFVGELLPADGTVRRAFAQGAQAAQTTVREQHARRRAVAVSRIKRAAADGAPEKVAAEA